MFDFTRCRHTGRQWRGWLGAVVLTFTACTESLPTEPEPAAATVLATDRPAMAIEDARASLEDAVGRVLPALEDETAGSALREALEQLVLRLEGEGSGHAELERVQALVEAYPRADSPGELPDLDALGLALSSAERALAPRTRR